MDTNYLAFITADPDFYDVEDAQTPVDLGLVAAAGALERGWQVRAEGPWIVHRGPRALPRSGWKVHVSARPERAEEVIDAALQVCHELGVSVKHLRTHRLVLLTQAKYAAKESAGKVLTAYPADDAELDDVVACLSRQLAGEEAARVLSDLPVPGCPVGLRYGAFFSTWVVGDDGRAVPGISDKSGSRPDRRAAHQATAGAPQPWPQVVQRSSRANAEAASRAVIDIRDVQLLHRSNAGGVYRGRWTDGRDVVVKEARHHTGFDLGGADAVDRLRQEYAALVALAQTGVAPKPVEYLTVGDSDMLVMEYVAGPTAATRMATEHPGVVPSGSAGAEQTGRPSATAPYGDWCTEFLGRVREAITQAHRAGVEHRDLHPANIVDAESGVVLLDWESSSVAGEVVATGVAAARLGENGDEGDVAGLARLETTLLNPLSFVLDRRPELESELNRVGRADVAAGGRLTQLGEDTRHSEAHRVSRQRVRAGLAAVATPHRVDRLFPGDIAQFQNPVAGLGLLHGAAGVLLALQLSEREEPEEQSYSEHRQLWCDWLIAATDRAQTLIRGWGDGLDGVAVALARLGEVAAAAKLAGRLFATDVAPTTAPWWGSGRAGMAVAAAELSVLLQDVPQAAEGARTALDAHVRSVLSAIAADTSGARPGLVAGWSGVAAGLLRVAELVPDLAERCRVGAAEALGRESAGAHRVLGGLLLPQGRALMPYLGSGSAALGYTVAAAASHDVTLPGAVSSAELCAQVARSLRCPVVPDAGLMLGRAGNLMVLEQLAPGDPDVGHHRDRLSWHLIRGERASRGVAGDLVLGNQHLRCSADLATGAAGVLLALHPATTGSAMPLLASVLGLPVIRTVMTET